jgi:hypothetical protein
MESAADATERKIKALLAKGEQDLKEIDEAFILSARGHKVRKQPSFRPEEISLGPVLVSSTSLVPPRSIYVFMCINT